jgi:uncharacterized membrane protein (DUF2068 family)
MRLVPRRWHNETWICSIRGHVTPAAVAERLRPGEDDALGFDVPADSPRSGTRLSRCLRCDAWVERPAPRPDEAAYEVIPPLTELELPRRGKALSDAIVLRLIAIERGVHAVIFTLLAVALLFVAVRLPAIQHWAQSIADGLNTAVANTAQAGSHAFLTKELAAVAELDENEVWVLLATSAVYAVVEGIEAVFLWKERRWAEYLTVIATVGFIPFEVRELIDRVTFLRVGALVVNLAILVYLVWAKRLFGIRGGAAALEETIDWDEILQPTADLSEKSAS